MPVIKITQASKGNNKGSCGALEKYLQKENQGKDFSEFTHWYEQERDYVPRGEVVHRIDTNHKGLGKEDAKFFMLTINYSEKEISFINQKFSNNQRRISQYKRNYTRQVMDTYAKNFGKNITGRDLVYFAINEQNRYYKGQEEMVQKGEAKQRDAKEGLNDHTHIIISRRDKEKKYKLSPLTNHKNTQKGKVKGGFNRVQFKLDCEAVFDQSLGYRREFIEKAEVLIKKAKGEIMIEPKQEIVIEKLIEKVAVKVEEIEPQIVKKRSRGMSM